MNDLSAITVLVPAGLNAHALERLENTFKLVRIKKSDPSLLTDDMVKDVRGLACGTTIDAAFIDALPSLEIIANFGVGYDSVDAAHAASRKVMVTHTPSVLDDEVADTAVGLLISTVRELPKAEKWLRDGKWENEGNYRLTPLTLQGRSVGIYGLGRIGKAIAKRLEAFGLPISYFGRTRQEDVDYAYYSSLTDMAKAVDTLIAVAPGGEATHNTVDAGVFAALGEKGVFVNIGRGSVVDEDALAEALNNGTIAAAGLDVFDREPHVPEALMKAENAVLLPHVGSASEATRDAMADLVVDNLIAWFSTGKAKTPVPETRDVKAKAA